MTKNTTSKKTPAKKSAPKPATKKTAAKTSPAKKPATPKTKASAALTTAQRVYDAVDNLKGKNIVCLDVRKLTDITDTVIIVSGTSSRHVKSLADNAMLELKKAGHRAYGAEGIDAGEWALVDFGDVVLHVMQPHVREFYDLEKLWSTPASAPVVPNKKPTGKKPADKDEG